LNIYYLTRRTSAQKSIVNLAEHKTPSIIHYLREEENSRKLIHPLLLVEGISESPRMASLKWELTRTIKEWQKDGRISAVSVYFAALNDMSWMGIGSDEQYLPGSLMKVPIMLYYLKQEQEHPGAMNKEFVYERPKVNFPQQNYVGDSIVPGRKYKISELLRYMIAESDNNATFVLSMHIQGDEYRQMFSDLDITPYEVSNTLYSISPRQYSKFFRVLYSATYLNEQWSEYALELLSKCNFREGLVRDIPRQTIVAHKFGERSIDYDMNFSESAIVFYHSNPYLLTIMTKGRDIKLQTDLVSELSREIYLKYGNI
jgi:beta-lactamase class A